MEQRLHPSFYNVICLISSQLTQSIYIIVLE